MFKKQLPESPFHDRVFDIGPFRFGFSHHLIGIEGNPYMERWIFWFGLGTLRLHKFFRGDDERAPHDHPWPFITFPFKSYWEQVFEPEMKVSSVYNYVKAFRFHYRPAKYCHIVKMSPRQRPFWTFVISGRKTEGWGFWPYNGLRNKREFVSWRKFK